MNKVVNVIKGLIIICVSIIYLYLGRFMTIIIGMFLSAFRWDGMNVFLSFVLYIEQLFVMAILTWCIFKERDIIRWCITAILGGIVLSFMIVYYESVSPLIEQIRFYFYDCNIIIDYIILIIISFLFYWVLPSSRFKKESEDKAD